MLSEFNVCITDRVNIAPFIPSSNQLRNQQAQLERLAVTSKRTRTIDTHRSALEELRIAVDGNVP